MILSPIQCFCARNKVYLNRDLLRLWFVFYKEWKSVLLKLLTSTDISVFLYKYSM